ncbi:MAG: hypothetical protein KKH98_02470 [Spirochaetes bacterium]|nr:hypothetical protein [Spirochaetota bacterium]
MKIFFQLLSRWYQDLASFCPKPYPGLSKDETFLVTGHRGAAAYEVENTINACEKALLKYNANALEIDICFTKDKQAVLWHDWDPDEVKSLLRQAGLEPCVKYKPRVPSESKYRQPVHKLTLAELREHYGYSNKRKWAWKIHAHIPTLQEFMEWAQDKDSLKCVFLDLKASKDEIHLLGNIITEIKKLRQRYRPGYQIVIMTPDEVVLKKMQSLYPGAEYALDSLLPYGLVLDPESYSSVKKAKKAGTAIASAGRPIVFNVSPWTSYRRMVQHDVLWLSTHDRKKYNIKKIICWTINKKKEMRCLLKLGVNGIISDYPKKLSKQARKAGEKSA